MTVARCEVWLQITAGQGPVECAWAVIKVLEKLREDAASAGLDARTLDLIPGPEAGTANSALVALSGGADLDSFANAWRGSVQWIARSPFRPEHKRKNWFVGIEVLEPVEETHFDPRDVRWETMRASGPGGQHVNRTESAVRVTHLPTGIQASAAEERSQHRNCKLALARLAKRIADRGEEQHGEAREKRWRAHGELEDGDQNKEFGEGAE
jgi:peptide chain release factor